MEGYVGGLLVVVVTADVRLPSTGQTYGARQLTERSHGVVNWRSQHTHYGASGEPAQVL